MSDGKKILVVDDEPQVTDMIKMRLENAGHQILTASNGEEGLAKVREGVDLIISDVLMPVMDGFAFYKELKKSSITADIPVLILTARGKMEDSFKVMGADEFIAKPFDSKEFLEKVEKLLGRHKSITTKIDTAKRILIAGSDSETVENMVLQIKKEGCHTDLVESGAQIISKAVLFLPNVLIMEVQMDGISSDENIKILRQMPQFEKIPILTYSFYRLSDLEREDVRQKALNVDVCQKSCKEAGATEFIGRYNENSFIETINKYLE